MQNLLINIKIEQVKDLLKNDLFKNWALGIGNWAVRIKITLDS